MVPLVGNMYQIKEIGAKCKYGNAIGTNGTNATIQWYHWENPEHTHVHIACVWGSPMVLLVGNIFIICTNLITNGTIGKEIGANGKMVMPPVPTVSLVQWEAD